MNLGIRQVVRERRAAIALSLSLLAIAGCGRDDIAPTIRTVNRTRSFLPARTTSEADGSDAAISLAAFNLPTRPSDFDLASAAAALSGSAFASGAIHALPCANLVEPADALTLADIAAAIASESASEPFASAQEFSTAIGNLIPTANVDAAAIARVPDSASPCVQSPSTVASSSVGEAIAFSCSDSEADIRARGGQSLTFGNTTIYIGYQQVSRNNQDPRLIRFDNGDRVWCRDDYEITGDDSQGYGLVWNGDRDLYAAFSSTGTQGSSTEDFREFAESGWLKSYGSGGGAKVAVLARINPDTGDVDKATFLTAQLSSGNSNTVVVKELDFANDELRVRADSFYSPRKSDRSPFSCEG
ncbi:MAG: hypothetical protein AAFY15_07680, partial [Cyanobacteria bacterium J06648_11]